jgi:two-component system NtrC family sensor kinase
VLTESKLNLLDLDHCRRGDRHHHLNMSPATRRTAGRPDIRPLPSEEDAVPPASARIHRVVVVLRGLMLASVILPLGFLVTFAVITHRLALAGMERLVQRTVDVLHEHTLKVFETQELILDQVAGLISGRAPGQIPDLPELVSALKRLEQGRDQIAAIWMIDAHGEIRGATRPWSLGMNSSDRDYFQAHTRGEIGTYVGKSFTGRATGKASFGFSRRWPAADGAFDGVISISVSSDYFASFFRNTAAEIDHVAALIRTDGEVLARDPSRRGSNAVSPEDPLMRAIAEADRGLIWRVSPVDGEERLLGYRRVDGYPVAVGMAVTKSAALQPWLNGLLVYAGVTTTAALALFGLTFFGLRRVRREEIALDKLASEARKRAQIEAQLRRSQKLEALGQLTGGVAHDFGNVLTAVIGNLHLVRERPDHPRSAARVDDALAAANLGERLVRSLLAFARRQPLALDTLDVNKVIQGIQVLLQQSLGSRATLVLRLAPKVWPIRADATQIEMAVLNLVVNARDAMTAIGTVTIATRNVTLRGDEEGLVGDYVALVVSDNGSGMTSEVLAHVFEPFFTTKAAGKGTGLGLATVYGFTRQCGGAAAIESAVGKGTEVTIYLPRLSSPSGEQQPPGPSASEKGG